jgi:hypothetical protein
MKIQESYHDNCKLSSVQSRNAISAQPLVQDYWSYSVKRGEL